MVYKRSYMLQSPGKKAGRMWGDDTSHLMSGARHGAPGRVGRSRDPVNSVKRRALMSRAELVEELSTMNVDEPTLTCCACCGPSIRRCSRRRLPLFRPSRVTSLFWMEKAMLAWEMMQLYGLLWALALPWPWPATWRRWSSWSVVLNFDSLSLGQNTFLDTPLTTSVYIPRSDRGQLDGFVWAWFGWFLAAISLPLGYWGLRWALQLSSADWQQFRSHAWHAVNFTLCMMYLPIQLWLARAFACVQLEGDATSRLSVDASLECGGAEHIVMSVFSGLVMLGMVVYAIYLIRHIRRNVVYDRSVLHERHLRWKEAEYLHFINQEWLVSGFWLWSSFTRLNAAYRPVRMLFKTACVLVFALLHDYVPTQASLTLLLLSGWAVWETFVPAYRCGSTRALSLCFNWILVVDALLGAMRAYKTSNPVMVDTNFTIIMALVNGAAFLALLSLPVFAYCNPHVHWPAPSPATSNARSARREDPFRYAPVSRKRNAHNTILPPAAISATQREDEFEITTELQWVSAILRANAEVSQAQLGAPELVDPTILDASARQLRLMWRDARATKHVMAWSLLDAIDELSALADACRRRSYLPNRALTRLLPDLVVRLRRRSERLALVTPTKRRIFIKLLAFRSWIGERVFERIPMGNGERVDSVRYNLNPFSVIRQPPSVGAVSVMTASDLLRDMPAIMRARPTGHAKVTSRMSKTGFEKSAKLMRAVQNRWAELLLEYERSFTVGSDHMRGRLRDATEVAAWYAAARQINSIVASIDRVDPLMGRSTASFYPAQPSEPQAPIADVAEFGAI